jgi:Zn-dependent M28 family amino/carboxypeptidase
VPIEVPSTGNFIAVVGNEASRGLVDHFVRLIEGHTADLPHVALTVPGNGELLPDTRRSDHAPFWDAGYRAIMLTDTTNFRNPHYHRASDTLATLNLEFAAKVGTVTAALVMKLAQPAG